MPKRARKSAEFGLWVKGAREASGKTQNVLAKEAHIKQQTWSRIEQGIVPTPDELATLCRVLGRPQQEAEAILATTNKVDERARMLEQEFDDFRHWLIERPQPTQLFVIREDPEPINDIAIDMHCGILEDSPDLHMSILFRHSDPRIWETFRRFLRAIENKWIIMNEDDRSKDEEPRKRITGYYRNPEMEENPTNPRLSIPMAQPVILVIDANASAELFCYGSHDDVYESYKRAGKAESQAAFKSTMLLRAPKVKAELFASWVGSNIWLGLEPKLWEPIPWPDLKASNT